MNLIRSFTANYFITEALRAKPKALKRLSMAFFIIALLAFIPSLLAWIFNWRIVSSIALMLSLLMMALPLIINPLTAGVWVSRFLQQVADGDEIIPVGDPLEMSQGIVFRALFRSRWILCLGLAFLPALALNLFRADYANFLIWQASALTLGSVADTANSALLLNNGGIPLFRLILRAASLLACIPFLYYLGASLGTLAAFFRPEGGRAMFLGLMGSLILSVGLLVGWQQLSMTPVMAGAGEILRLLLMTLALFILRLLTGLIHRIIKGQLEG